MTPPVQQVLTVMVVTLNEERHIPALKNALDKLHLPEGWRIESILVDGGSRDATVEVARAAGFEDCQVLPGASIPVCRNQALRSARGHALAFLDADCLPDREWFQHALPWLEKPGPVMLGYPVHPPKTGNWIQRTWHAHWHHKHSASQQDQPAPVTKGAARLLTTRNMLFNRALLDIVPSFDETLSTGEDTDFAFRASQAGGLVVALPTLRVTHLGEPSTLRQYFRQQLWHANRKAYGTILRSAGRISGANAIFFSVFFLLALCLALLSLPLAVIFSSLWGLLLLLPLVLVTAAPAALIADRASSPALFFRLCILYFLYGLARAIDLIGLSPRKQSWKS
ncbi:MAG: glycosyltransferase [Kiritimatiellia bacterium]|jgi:cellulose synthase/poly-beta-1,6-N-acetylglucosamine synthase-like glycosyltransferase|nr:glycosyltransferase [Kiritimatiellia bacterium]